MVSLRRITAKVMANLVKISATVMTGSGHIAVTEGGELQPGRQLKGHWL